MFTKNIHYLVCLLALGLGLILVACQPIQAPNLSTGAPNSSNLSVTKQIPGGPTVAFVHERSLYIHPGDLAVTIEDCASGCHVYYPTWPPDGNYLTYFYRPASAENPFEIRLTDLRGAVQTVFARISDSKARYTALNEGTLTVDNVDEMRPTVDVLRLQPGNDRPEVWLPNVTQVVLAPASTLVAATTTDLPIGGELATLIDSLEIR